MILLIDNPFCDACCLFSCKGMHEEKWSRRPKMSMAQTDLGRGREGGGGGGGGSVCTKKMNKVNLKLFRNLKISTEISCKIFVSVSTSNKLSSWT